MNTRAWFGMVVAITFLSGAQVLARPNVVVILADDLGYGDLGYTGSKEIPTPHIDRLASEGVVCSYGYVTHPYCGPSRAAFMTGRYQQRFGFEANPPYAIDNPFSGLPESEMTIAQRLKTAGYRTGMVGKWHLGSHAIHHPNNRGFDFFFGFPGGGHDYFSVDTRKPSGEGYLQPLMRNGRPADMEGYLTTQLTDEAIGFINRNREKPFFLYVAYNAPHTPLQAPKETVEQFAHLEGWERRTYAAMVHEMDRNIGRLIETLVEQGLSDNTLVFFLSDNGGNPHWDKTKPAFTCNAPFRGYKGDTYDGGVHVPFLACWPGTLPAGTTYGKPVVSIDITRTAAALAGADESNLEGTNLMPFLLGSDEGNPHEGIYFRRRNHAAWGVVTPDGYKWLKNDWDRENEMYHLFNDVAEERDLVSADPDRARAMEAMWTTWDKDNVPFTFSCFTRYHGRVQEFYKTLKPE